MGIQQNISDENFATFLSKTMTPQMPRKFDQYKFALAIFKEQTTC